MGRKQTRPARIGPTGRELRCSRCETYLPLTAFFRGSCADGYTSRCRACAAQDQADRRARLTPAQRAAEAAAKAQDQRDRYCRMHGLPFDGLPPEAA